MAKNKKRFYTISKGKIYKKKIKKKKKKWRYQWAK
jgi:hypothetical protein